MTVPRRVLMTIDAVGGIWRYAMDAALGLKQRGIEVVFAGFGPPPEDAQRAEAGSVGACVWSDAPLDWLVTQERDLANVAARIDDLATEMDADLLHVNLPSQAAGLRTRCPVVVVAHSCVVTWFRSVRDADVPSDWAWQRRRNAAGFARAGIVAVPSDSFARDLHAAYVDLPPMVVVPNAVAPLNPAREREPYVLAAARWWDDGKNAGLVDRLAALIGWPLHAAGAVVGPAGQQATFAAATALGSLGPVELRRLMQQAAIFVSASRYEPFGLAVLEAASGGAALVLSDIPTHRELWDDAALFAGTADPAGFAERIADLVADPELRAELANRASRRAAEFSLDRQADAMLRCYARAA